MLGSSPKRLFAPRLFFLLETSLCGPRGGLCLAGNDRKFGKATVGKLGIAAELKASKKGELPERYLKDVPAAQPSIDEGAASKVSLGDCGRFCERRHQRTDRPVLEIGMEDGGIGYPILIESVLPMVREQAPHNKRNQIQNLFGVNL